MLKFIVLFLLIVMNIIVWTKKINQYKWIVIILNIAFLFYLEFTMMLIIALITIPFIVAYKGWKSYNPLMTIVGGICCFIAFVIMIYIATQMNPAALRYH